MFFLRFHIALIFVNFRYSSAMIKIIKTASMVATTVMPECTLFCLKDLINFSECLGFMCYSGIHRDLISLKFAVCIVFIVRHTRKYSYLHDFLF